MLSSERVGVAANIKEAAPLADYFHYAVRALNLSCSQAMSVTEIRHAQDVIMDVTTSVIALNGMIIVLA